MLNTTGKTAVSDRDDQAAPGLEDRPLRQALTEATRGGPPLSTLTMMQDWALHLAAAPDKQLSLIQKAQRNWLRWARFVAAGCPEEDETRAITPQPGDRRFNDEAWTQAPYAAFAQAFLLAEDFADHATSDVPGLTAAHDRSMTFLARQFMDAFAPSNFLMTNPEAMRRTLSDRGENLAKGSATFLRDWQALVEQKHARPASRVGKDLALTPGKVVFRNHLMELIQYAPTTDAVHPEPVLIVPAWIMKYYILDLSPENSFVRYLVDQGYTVYIISWRNPDSGDAGFGMADYLEQGPQAAVDHICRKTEASKVHGLGYCLGGTLLAIEAARMARDGDARLASMTLLAAQTDFSEAGELMMFIDESQVSFLEDVMANQGYLDASQMAGAFQMLRSNDLIWSRMVRSYLLGDADPSMNDLMAWNADSTRMPARMHSEYLRHMFLNNDLAAGRYLVDGNAISLRDIRIPVFCVGTETDHIAPWKSVFKIHALGHADVSFVLTNGGHNAGVLSEPGHRHRHFRIHTTRDQDRALAADGWLEAASVVDGSWWPALVDWLGAQSSEKTKPPKMSGDLGPAPGTYVMME